MKLVKHRQPVLLTVNLAVLSVETDYVNQGSQHQLAPKIVLVRHQLLLPPASVAMVCVKLEKPLHLVLQIVQLVETVVVTLVKRL